MEDFHGELRHGGGLRRPFGPGPSGRSGRRPPERLFPGRGFEGRGLGRLHPGTGAAAA